MRWEEGWVTLSYYLFDTTRLILLRSTTWEYRSEFKKKKKIMQSHSHKHLFCPFPFGITIPRPLQHDTSFATGESITKRLRSDGIAHVKIEK